MITPKQILQEQATSLIDLMRFRLNEKILKEKQYYSRTNASFKLSRMLRYTLEGPEDNAVLTILGTDYWRAADAGQAPPVKVTVAEILTWMRFKGIKGGERKAKSIVEKLRTRGTNKPPSKFFTRYRDDWSKQTIDRLTAADLGQKTIEEATRIKDVEITINISSEVPYGILEFENS